MAMRHCQILGTHWDADELFFFMSNSLGEPLYNFLRHLKKTMSLCWVSNQNHITM